LSDKVAGVAEGDFGVRLHTDAQQRPDAPMSTILRQWRH
jgi:hypothetical protein